ncbi:MAG: fibronectin type III domain-containing protein, partial [Paludibacteraceae bacterium]|nr:fibronectin type III domain-containing protein [Paludibacteraceae bacterium]
MKKTLLLLFSLLIFVGNVWGDYTCTLFENSSQTVAGNNGTKQVALGASYEVATISLQVKSKSWTYTNNFQVGISGSGSTEIYNDRMWNESWNDVQKTLNKKVSDVYFKNTTAWSISSKDRYFQNLSFSIKTTNLESFGNVEAGTTSSVKRSLNVLSTSTPTLICPNGFSATVQKGNGYSYTVTISFSPTEIKPYSGNITLGGQVVATVSGTGTLASPTGVKVTPAYDTAELSWNSVSGAENYLVTYGDSTKTITSTNLTCNGLELGTKYTFSVQAQANGTSSDASSVQGTTNDLSASTSFTLSDATYTTCHGSWAQIPNATGYKVVASNGAATYFDGATTTSGTIAGLLPNNSYTCTVYGMYNNSVSKKGKTS